MADCPAPSAAPQAGAPSRSSTGRSSVPDNTARVGQARILLGCFLGVASGYSSTYFYSSGILLVPITHDLGITRGEATLGLFASSMTAAVMAPLLGRAVDRLGARLIGLISLVGLVVSFLVAAWLAAGLASLIATSMLIALLGAGSSSVSFSRLVVDTFDRRRGLALAVMQTGAGLGAFVIPFILSSALRDGDWRAAYRLLALVVLTCGVLVAGLIARPRADSPSDHGLVTPGSGSGGTAVWRTRPFLILAATFVLAATAIAAAVVHFVPMMIDGGVSAARASRLASLLGIALIAGRLVTGWLLDRLVPEYVAAALFLTTSAGLAVLAVGGTTVAIGGALVVGLAIGSEVDLLSYLTARHFAREQYGTAYGGAFGVFLFGSAIGPSAMGLLFDHFGNYRAGFLFAAILLVVSAGFAVLLRRLCSPMNGPASDKSKAAPVSVAGALGLPTSTANSARTEGV